MSVGLALADRPLDCPSWYKSYQNLSGHTQIYRPEKTEYTTIFSRQILLILPWNTVTTYHCYNVNKTTCYFITKTNLCSIPTTKRTLYSSFKTRQRTKHPTIIRRHDLQFIAFKKIKLSAEGKISPCNHQEHSGQVVIFHQKHPFVRPQGRILCQR